MTNSTKTTKISAALLATVLIAGIFALSSSSFMVGAQAVPEYGMEKKYNSEEPQYGMDSYDKKSYGQDSYETTDYQDDKKSYGMDSYDKKSYGMDSYDKKSYGQDSYETTDYQDDKKYNSYEPERQMDSYTQSYGKDDYKTEYPSYGKDDYKKSSDSVIVKKVKCNNINVNLNGLNVNGNGDNGNGDNGNGDNGNGDNGNGDNGNGDNGNGDNGDDLAPASLSGNGETNNGNGERNHKFVDKKDGFTFVCINNNNNAGGGGTPTDDECAECFTQLETAAPTIFAAVETAIAAGIEIDDFVFEGGEIADFCAALSAHVEENGPITITISQILTVIRELEPTDAELEAILDFILCLVTAGLVDVNVADLEAEVALLQG